MVDDERQGMYWGGGGGCLGGQTDVANVYALSSLTFDHIIHNSRSMEY